ncbi:hypothetical protein ATE48_15660 [Candidatus Viadribacter manganicus]|uniref:Uncharacterized protein n=1 Tax=Candidatus Viadribacter manganicus TaxID=1759059 RepID=A0A1B1AL03_9PROT|nr:hypothetical protein ATE48_15660 [Candidatus Viadribacter manganicus]
MEDGPFALASEIGGEPLVAACERDDLRDWALVKQRYAGREAVHTAIVSELSKYEARFDRIVIL